MNQAHSQRLAARAKSIPEYRTLSGQGLKDVELAMDDNDAVQELLSIKGEPQGILSQYLPFLRDNVYSKQDFIAEVSMVMQFHPQKYHLHCLLEFAHVFQHNKVFLLLNQ